MNQRAYKIIIITLTCVCVMTIWKHLRLLREIRQSYTKDVTLQGVDAKTKQPLPISLEMPAVSQDQLWPRDMSVTAVDPSKLLFRWIGVDPVQIRIQSDGYQPQVLTLDNQSQPQIVVELKRN